MRTEARGLSLSEPVEVDLLNMVGQSISPPVTARIPGSRYAALCGLAAAGLIWDLWTKWAVFNQLGHRGRKPIWTGSIFGVKIQFDFATTFNPGALWGVGAGFTWVFALLSFVAIAVIAYFVWTRHAVASWWLTITSGLLLAGTLGNLYDRLGLHGWRNGDRQVVYAVRDFLDFSFNDGAFNWATFNFADTYLVTGAIMLGLLSLWSPHPGQLPSVAASNPAENG